MTSRAIWLGLALLAGAGAGAGGVVWWNGDQKPAIEQAAAAKLETDRMAGINQRIAAQWGALANDPSDPVLGNPDGDVTIVAFFDYACAYCKAAEPRLMAALARDGRTRLVLKEFPILTPESMIATRAALAAARQGKYQPFHQAMMAWQGALTPQVIMDTARQTGLDMARLEKDMQDPAIAEKVIGVFNLARAIRAFQTPTFIAGNRLGAHVLGSQSAAIDFTREIAIARGQ